MLPGWADFHFSGDGGPATLARLHGPYALAAGNSGDFFVADLLNRRVRRVDAAGRITTVAGDGSTALFDEIAGLAVDASGVLWIATGPLTASGSSARVANSPWCPEPASRSSRGTMVRRRSPL